MDQLLTQAPDNTTLYELLSIERDARRTETDALRALIREAIQAVEDMRAELNTAGGR